ncbi:MAG: hypothetical protein PVJ01_00715 [Pseudomonadota bacterium]|jgi:hypothetical protein
MHIHLVHPKFLNDDLIVQEHDFLHELFDSLGTDEPMEHPDAFRYNGRRGQLYARHRRLVEEMIIRGISHTALMDRRDIDPEHWDEPEITPEDLFKQVEWLRGQPAGRVALPESEDPRDYTCMDDISTVLIVHTELDILQALWRIYRFTVMERSYSRYRSLSETLQGRGKASVFMLFDMILEETFAQDPDDRAPAIAYETLWEYLQEGAIREESDEYERLAGELVPGAVSLDMRRFLAAVAARQGIEELTRTALLAPYVL